MPTLRPRPEPPSSTRDPTPNMQSQRRRVQKEQCIHPSLITASSSHAKIVDYIQPGVLQSTKTQDLSLRSTTVKGKRPIASAMPPNPETFPSPLVLPDDELSLDPKYPRQSFLSWKRLMQHRQVTPKQKTIYVVSPPEIDDDVNFVDDWSIPSTINRSARQPKPKSKSKPKSSNVQSKAEAKAKKTEQPSIDDMAAYTRAFYHPLPVKVLPSSTLRFVSWSEEDTSALRSSSSLSISNPSHSYDGGKTHSHRHLIGLQTPQTIIGITTRPSLPPSPDQPPTYTHQLSLNPLIDVCLSILPPDAYALVLVTNHDLYEDEDDEFICGRAYGGSRVAVVSSARYNPCLDKDIGLDAESGHGVWPGSHCAEFVNEVCRPDDDEEESDKAKKKRKRSQTTTVEADKAHLQSLSTRSNIEEEKKEQVDHLSPLRSAILASLRPRQPPRSETHLPTPTSMTRSTSPYQPTNQYTYTYTYTYLYRLVRTLVHELGHIFGLDHCVYHACIMQGSASLLEDHRQPPYLCPIDLAKILGATGTTETTWLEEMRKVCIEFSERERSGGGGGGGGNSFGAFEAWIGARLKQLEKDSRS